MCDKHGSAYMRLRSGDVCALQCGRAAVGRAPDGTLRCGPCLGQGEDATAGLTVSSAPRPTPATDFSAQALLEEYLGLRRRGLSDDAAQVQLQADHCLVREEVLLSNLHAEALQRLSAVPSWSWDEELTRLDLDAQTWYDVLQGDEGALNDKAAPVPSPSTRVARARRNRSLDDSESDKEATPEKRPTRSRTARSSSPAPRPSEGEGGQRHSSVPPSYRLSRAKVDKPRSRPVSVEAEGRQTQPKSPPSSGQGSWILAGDEETPVAGEGAPAPSPLEPVPPHLGPQGESPPSLRGEAQRPALVQSVRWDEAPIQGCLLYTSPSPRDATLARMPSSA